MAGLGMAVVFYSVQVLGMQDFRAPLYFFVQKWYFIAPLIISFAVQAGLFRLINLKMKSGIGMVAATGGVSVGSMVACCMHNLVSFLPIVGLTGAAMFFSIYQDYVFGLSLFFAAAGVIFMSKKYKKINSCCKNYDKNIG
ncbi:hypothetical protein C4569_02075 [Candidatus Parcubacteria bacterium]|nr:MAG: hypothetical protein C4569_02075 [Candidatus Parcubacteria bacterium]